MPYLNRDARSQCRQVLSQQSAGAAIAYSAVNCGHRPHTSWPDVLEEAGEPLVIFVEPLGEVVEKYSFVRRLADASDDFVAEPIVARRSLDETYLLDVHEEVPQRSKVLLANVEACDTAEEGAELLDLATSFGTKKLQDALYRPADRYPKRLVFDFLPDLLGGVFDLEGKSRCDGLFRHWNGGSVQASRPGYGFGILPKYRANPFASRDFQRLQGSGEAVDGFGRLLDRPSLLRVQPRLIRP